MTLNVIPLQLTVNGDRVSLSVEPSRTLLELLRYDLTLTGTKQGCDKGDCGACTVLIDGIPKLSCLVLALDVEGKDVRTVESLKRGTSLHPLQQAFIDCGAAQCGFCTPGMLMSAVALLETTPSPDAEQIREAISGNLCRCTGYTKIVEAIAKVAQEKRA